jgi:hypothetical protein
MIFAILVVKLMIILLGRINDNDPNKFHQYSGYMGILYIIFGITYFLIFVYGIK